ncbi:hypothetical protein GUJ93_ZPchr0003g17703 [Zizania palustris]|uniref:Uncharacterized protein n=1 Tax=Zizania palustris TaxID=103762 RepID=A0A8J5S685_ZIZPA|nr:hypothetical protein GUJ93_ZPchr0003g17703 [Zizania palustris]
MLGLCISRAALDDVCLKKRSYPGIGCPPISPVYSLIPDVVTKEGEKKIKIYPYNSALLAFAPLELLDLAMDWDAKMPSWDLDTVVSPSGGGGGGAVLDLKLGTPMSWKAVAAVATAVTPILVPQSSASAKRPW